MRVFRPIVTLLLTAACGASLGVAQVEPAPQADGKAGVLLERVAETYRNLEKFYFEATEITETRSRDAERTTEVRLVTALDSSGRARLEVFNDINSRVVVFDGETRWVYYPQRGEYQKATLESAAESGSNAAARFAADPAKPARRYPARYSGIATNILEARFLRREEIGTASKGGEYAVVQVNYRTPAGVPKSIIRRTYWIDERRFLVAREVSVAEMKGSAAKSSSAVKEKISFSEMKINQDVPEQAFTFVPPDSAKLEAEFVSAAQRWVGRSAPEVTLPALTGRSYSLADLRGKVVLLDFWATWCAPCRIDLPHIEKLHQEFSFQGLVVLGVNAEAPGLAANFFEQRGYSFPSLVDREKRLSALFEVAALPTVVIIDRQGRIASFLVGLQSDERLRGELKKVGIE